MPSNSVRFVPNNLEANALVLEGALNLHKEEDVPVTSFIIVTQGGSTTTVVEDGKYKSALLLAYFAQIEGKDNFSMCGQHDLVREYFGAELYQDALYNPETKHSTIRDLLADGIVTVSIQRKKLDKGELT